uniref:Uncharacterized protein n=1 Tax=Glossina brevipalpis TaxID=37001 RepID=A0A1A9W9S7_9MUSC
MEYLNAKFNEKCKLWGKKTEIGCGTKQSKSSLSKFDHLTVKENGTTVMMQDANATFVSTHILMLTHNRIIRDLYTMKYKQQKQINTIKWRRERRILNYHNNSPRMRILFCLFFIKSNLCGLYGVIV